jgi:hypothetical protein
MATPRKPRRIHGRIFFEDWSVCDPDLLCGEDGAMSRAHRACFPFGEPATPEVTIDRAALIALAAAAEAYVHLTTHPAGTESVVQQLRAIRRALKEPR